jgi:hypothetical protein
MTIYNFRCEGTKTHPNKDNKSQIKKSETNNLSFIFLKVFSFFHYLCDNLELSFCSLFSNEFFKNKSLTFFLLQKILLKNGLKFTKEVILPKKKKRIFDLKI